MLNRSGDPQCLWCGDTIEPARGKSAPDCCSRSCARDYAEDMGHPIKWQQYLQTTNVCTACGVRPVAKGWCDHCKYVWKVTQPPPDKSTPRAVKRA